ncbi:hypothetical protein R1flu_015696 [Riccia fluitans]|uniref:Uncharacterized protein n=1 Tax=Riccia fluitans TaxID=41844 RepID=A0ABD1YK01_9MARC
MGAQLSNETPVGVVGEGPLGLGGVRRKSMRPTEPGARASHVVGTGPAGSGEGPGREAVGGGTRRPGRTHAKAQGGVSKERNVAEGGPGPEDASTDHAISGTPEVGSIRYNPQ